MRLKRQTFAAERLRYEKSKSRIKETKSQMTLLAAGVSHEFNNILGAVDGHAEWALSSNKTEDLIEALEVAQIACARSAQITRALQGLAQVNEESFELLSAQSVLAEIKRLLAAEAKLKGIHFSIDNELKKDLNIYGNFSRLSEVLINLLRNSFDALLTEASSPPYSLALRLYATKTQVIFHVEDSGPGIDVSIAELIFQPFFTTKGVLREMKEELQVHDSTGSTPNEGIRGGAGLGLYLSRSIAQDHGGTLELGRAKILTGAAFVFSVPIAAERKSPKT